jgi:hypothetical protein
MGGSDDDDNDDLPCAEGVAADGSKRRSSR